MAGPRGRKSGPDPSLVTGLYKFASVYAKFKSHRPMSISPTISVLHTAYAISTLVFTYTCVAIHCLRGNIDQPPWTDAQLQTETQTDIILFLSVSVFFTHLFAHTTDYSTPICYVFVWAIFRLLCNCTIYRENGQLIGFVLLLFFFFFCLLILSLVCGLPWKQSCVAALGFLGYTTATTQMSRLDDG